MNANTQPGTPGERTEDTETVLPTKSPAVRSRVVPAGPRYTTIYFVQGEITGLIKIGVSCTPEARLSSLQACSPDRLILLATAGCNRYGQLELEMHARFAANRRHGEWFEPSADLLAHIAKIATGQPIKVPAPSRARRAQRRSVTKADLPAIRLRLANGEDPGLIASDYGVDRIRIASIQQLRGRKRPLPPKETR